MIENLAAKKFAGSVTDIPFHTGVLDKTNPRIAYPGINPLDWTTPPISRRANGMVYSSLAATNGYDPGVEQS